MNNSPELATKVSTKTSNANGRGSVYRIKYPSGTLAWRGAAHDVTGKRRFKNFRLKSQALDWVDEQRRARHAGEITYASNPKATTSEFLLNWVESQRAYIKFNTYKTYRASVKTRINPYIGHIPAAKLSAQAIEELFATLVDKGYKGGSVLGAFRALRAAFNYAEKKQILPNNPMRRVKQPKVKCIPSKPIPKSDWEKIYKEATKDPFMHARVEIGGMCGNRSGEVRGFLWSDLDLENSQLIVERQVSEETGKGLIFDSPKTNDSRVLYLSEDQIEILLTHKRHHAMNKACWKVDEDLIFPNSVGGKMDGKQDRRMFKQLCARAGVPYYQIARMRKTAYTNVAQLTDARTAMDYSGHKEFGTLINHYVHSTPESITHLLEGIDRTRPTAHDFSEFESDNAEILEFNNTPRVK